MPPILIDLLGLLGNVIRAIGFLAVGFALGRLVFDHFKLGDWRFQAILILGLFGLLVGITATSTAGSAGALALGIAAAYFMTMKPPKSEVKTESPQP